MVLSGAAPPHPPCPRLMHYPPVAGGSAYVSAAPAPPCPRIMHYPGTL